jgi:hypothetical protein
MVALEYSVETTRSHVIDRWSFAWGTDVPTLAYVFIREREQSCTIDSSFLQPLLLPFSSVETNYLDPNNIVC